MKKYIVETSKSSVWKWEVMANSEDEAKRQFGDDGQTVSKEQHITITAKEA